MTHSLRRIREMCLELLPPGYICENGVVVVDRQAIQHCCRCRSSTVLAQFASDVFQALEVVETRHSEEVFKLREELKRVRLQHRPSRPSSAASFEDKLERTKERDNLHRKVEQLRRQVDALLL